MEERSADAGVGFAQQVAGGVDRGEASIEGESRLAEPFELGQNAAGSSQFVVREVVGGELLFVEQVDDLAVEARVAVGLDEIAERGLHGEPWGGGEG